MACSADETDLNEACGVFGCVATGKWPTQLDVANIISLGLLGLQHRGQESAGIVTTYGNNAGRHEYFHHKGMGMVSQIFNADNLSRLKGNLGIGHTRYSTAGSSEYINCQPFVVDTLHGLIAVAHNGELVNALSLRKKVLRHGVGLSTGTDSELITQLLALTPPGGEPDGANWPARIKMMMKETLLAYSLVIMHGDKIYAVRDPYGNRPLCIGKLMANIGGSETIEKELDDCEGYVVSSESCAFQAIGAKYYREVLPGEIVEVSKHGIKSIAIVPRADEESKPAFCIFEYVYFARADSQMEGQMVYTARQRCGRQLAIESPVEADIVSVVPESATPAAMGYAQQIGLPFVEVLCRNRYVGRTFIQPSNRLRKLAVAKKFGPLVENFKGKRVVIVDDSIVRGNTMQPIVALLKSSGAKEVHIRLASPPIKHPCYMGINIPTKDELIANKLDEKALAKHLGADSVVYLSVGGLLSAVQKGAKVHENSQIGHCTACLTGKYPVNISW